MRMQQPLRVVIDNARNGELIVEAQAQDPDGFWFLLEHLHLDWHEAAWEVTNLAHWAIERYEKFGLVEGS